MCKQSREFFNNKKGENIPCGYSMSTILAFDDIENKHTLYRGEDCMKKFCTSLTEHATNVTNFQKKIILPLTREELKSYQDIKACYIYGKRIFRKFANDKSYQKVRDYFNKVNIETQHTVFIIYILMCLMKSL